MLTNISIHALRGEDDKDNSEEYKELLTFQSTPSVGRTTFNAVVTPEPNGISIHALRGEDDIVIMSIVIVGVLFQSTPSVGRTTCYSNI